MRRSVERVRVGFASVDVTPPLPTPLAGFASRTELSRGVLDPIHARCLALSRGDDLVVLLSIDVLGVHRKLRNEIASRVARALGVDPSKILVGATHTHSAPSIEGWYAQYLAEACVECAEKAVEDLESVEYVRAWSADCRDLVYNRRDPWRGPVDPQLRVVSFGDRAFILTLACHAVVLGPDNLLISADYPGYLLRAFSSLSKRSRTLFFNGCAGNVNPLTRSTDFRNPYRRRATYDEVASYGYALARRALSSVDSAKIVRSLDLELRSVELDLETFRPPPLELVEAMAREASLARDLYRLWLAKRLRSLVEERGYVDRVQLRISALRLGSELAIVFMPSEVFVEYQLEILERSPFPTTVVVGYVDSYEGYVPTPQAFAEGGYEVTYPVTLLKPCEGAKLSRAALDILEQLRALSCGNGS